MTLTVTIYTGYQNAKDIHEQEQSAYEMYQKNDKQSNNLCVVKTAVVFYSRLGYIMVERS